MARDPARYVFGGRRYPSVTEILTLGGHSDYDGVDPVVLQRAADRGSYIHEVSERIDARMIPSLDEIPDPYNTYVRSYCRFTHEHDYQVLHSEIVVRSHKHRFAGQCDRILILDGLLTVLDLKTADSDEGHDSWGLQTAAYALAFLEEHYQQLSIERPDLLAHPIQRCTLVLHHSGVPILQRWPRDDDYTKFLAAAYQVNAALESGTIELPSATEEVPRVDTLAAQLLRKLPPLPVEGSA